MRADERHDVMPAAVATLSTSAAEIAARSTVVVVDDNPVNIELLKRLLAAAGVMRVHAFISPREALAHCAESLPDLVLLDLHMPDLDGFDVMRALARMVPESRFVPVLVLTADVTVAVKERALAAGARDFLTKPFDRTEVLLRVANLLEIRALYGRLEERNAQLQSDLDARTIAEREAADAYRRCERRVDQALSPGVLSIVFQPVADLTTGAIVGAEALARFATEPYRPPNEWFADADEVGRGAELELAAASAALDMLGELPSDAFLAINASPAVATNPEFAALLARFPGERLVVELTEHTRVNDYDMLLIALDRFRRHGARIAVDDAGAGYAGLQHLLRLRPEIVKLDITLTRGIDIDPVRRSLAAALVTFAAETGATIIAEGVEVAGELLALQRIGIPWAQGYHLARPGPLPFPTDQLAIPGTSG